MKIEDILSIDVDLISENEESFNFIVRINEDFENDFNIDGDKLSQEVLNTLAKHMAEGIED